MDSINKEITIIIKTFNRKQNLIKILESIKHYYPLIQIIILDDSKKVYEKNILKLFPDLKITYISTEFDIGLSKGRNIMVKNVSTEYLLLCDDDYVFDDRTDLNLALEMIKTYNVDILGGLVLNRMKINNLFSLLWALKKPSRILDVIKKNEYPEVYNGKFYGDNMDLLLRLENSLECDQHIDVYETDIITNFFLANTQKVNNMGGWQPENIKVGEHKAFFWRAKKAGMRVMFSPMFSVLHFPYKTLNYSKYRLRANRMAKESFEAIGVKRFTVVDTNGKIQLEYDFMEGK